MYVEEVDTGSKPIEGVSTSTAGMLGVAERGPVNVPILITSFGEYQRWFGQYLRREDFSTNNGQERHCYLPHAVQGFFENGGKRVYVVRILDTGGATNAAADQFDRGTATSAATLLLRATPELSGSAANPPLLVALDATALSAGNWIRIGDGSQAEYRRVAIAPVGENTLVPLHLPFNRSHAAGVAVRQFDPNAGANRLGGALSLVVGGTPPVLAAGARSLVVSGATADIAALAANSLLEIGGGASREYRFISGAPRNVRVVSATNSEATIDLDSPLVMSYPNGTALQHLNSNPAVVAPATIDTPCSAGDRLLFVDNRAGAFNNSTHAVLTLEATADEREVRRIGALGLLPLDVGAYEAYPPAALVEPVTITDVVRSLTAAAGTLLTLDSVADLVVGQSLVVEPAAAGREPVTIQSINAPANQVTIVSALTNPHALPVPIVPAPKSLTAAVTAGASFLALDNRMGLTVDAVVRVGNAASGEFVTIRAIPNPAPGGVAPDAGTIQVAPALGRAYPAGTEVTIQAQPTVGALSPTVPVLAPQAGDTSLLIADGTGYTGTEIIRITTGSGERFYHRLAAPPTTPTPDVVTLDSALERTHPLGSAVVGRNRLFRVQALDPGAWGNRLRISVEDEPAGLVTQTELRQFGPPTRIRLGSLAGVESGTILEVVDPVANAVVGGLLKVQAVNRVSGEITLEAPGVDAAQAAAAAALPPGRRLNVRSREFRLTVRLLRQPDLAQPVRNETVIDSETFRYLSMDPRHSRYLQQIIGTTWNSAPGTTVDDGFPQRPLRLSDRRSEGESWYVRVRDLAQDLAEPQRTAALESIRLGPETLIDVLPDGRQQPARHALEDGDDSIATLTDAMYIGQDDPTPELRTGLESLRSIDEVSIVACPGRTSVQIQNALIAHCELLRYRFSVLDGLGPPDDTLPDVQRQRQQFDSKYAALYHPWLLVPDPFPLNPARIGEYPLPPSGHVLGVYARTDVERGVHKAPANEVVRGILGLQRLLTKEEQDILNPYPVNINVIRDFRDNNRGIRVFGGRVITSDSDWKYVNVRRLLIFIEASIDRGLQWVVFEPNAEPLWARVRRSISNFLTTVWRNGALEGTRPEEAYFVKCDRTTMTQTDIDSGRLIVLVGVAPVKPAEFVIVRIGLWTARADT